MLETGGFGFCELPSVLVSHRLVWLLGHLFKQFTSSIFQLHK
jgi:hypothetical protein